MQRPKPNSLFEPPPNADRSQDLFAEPGDELACEDQSFLTLEDLNPVPESIVQFLAESGVPNGMAFGTNLTWTNNCNLSHQFKGGRATINHSQEWIELELEYQTGKRSRLRMNWQMEVIALEWHTGMPMHTTVHYLCAQMALEFYKARNELMLMH